MKIKLKNKIITLNLITIISIGMFLPIKAQANTQSTNELNRTEPPSISPEISSELDLIKMQNSDGNFILTNDIEISGNWTPIINFSGTLEGSSHTITYNISEHTGPFPQTQYLGLFASCTDATIKNLHVEGNISLTTGGSISNPNVYVGGIIATSTNSILENVNFSGNINIVTSNDNSSYIGGLIGKATDNTKISLSYNTSQITSEIQSIIGNTKTGGLCGEFSGSIEDCYNTGNVLVTAANGSPYAGGLVGNSSGNITESYNSGKVQANGTSMSLSDVYAGGIVAVGESGSSVTKCAVMSPEINVTKGFVNSGYKYIISKGGTKSDNISINNIAGSPTDDSNARYTEADLKTTEPYDLSFYNTWTINENVNNGYPYHERNAYATKYISYQLIPDGFKTFIDSGYISVENFKQTDDGFTLCTKPISEIFMAMGINEIRSDQYDEHGKLIAFTLEQLDDWYIFNIEDSYSILKMRNGDASVEEGKTTNGKEKPGTSIPFIDFNLQLIELFHEELIQQENSNSYELQLYNEINKVTQGLYPSDYTYSVTIADYFSKTNCPAIYLIAEEYIKKVLSIDMDSNGYIKVPESISKEQKNFLLSLPNDIYEEDAGRIKVNMYGNLTNIEKIAILMCRTGNNSFNNFAAENILHARWTVRTGSFLQGTDENLVLEIEFIIGREAAKRLFPHVIKSDTGIGEEKVDKENFYFGLLESDLLKYFGDI